MHSVKFYYQLFKKLYHNGRFTKPAVKAQLSDSGQKEIISALETSGIFITENFLSTEECDEMRRKIDETMDSRSTDYFKKISEQVATGKDYKFGVPDEAMDLKFWADRNLSDIRIIKSENLSNSFHDLASKKDFFLIGNTITGKDLNLNFQMTNRVTFVEDNLGSGGGWHRDNNYSHGFKVLVYLDDVSPENGPFEYIPGSHLLRSHFAYTKKIDQYQFTNEEIDVLIKKHHLKTKVVTAKKGSAVFFNTNGIHRGQPIKAGRRYAVTNYYS